MAINKNLALLEEEDKKKALADKVAARAAADRGLMTSIFSGDVEIIPGFGTPGTMAAPAPITKPDPLQPSGKTISPEEEEAFRERHRSNALFGETQNPYPVEGYDPTQPAPSLIVEDDEIAGYDETQPAPSILRTATQGLNVNNNTVASVPVSTAGNANDLMATVEQEQANGDAYFNRLGQVESGGRANAQSATSSAKGLYQITDDTVASLSKRAGKQFDPMNPNDNRVMAEMLTKEHRDAFVNKFNREPTESELYIMHQQGQGKAMAAFQADPNANAVSVLGSDQVLNNGGNAEMTVSDYLGYWDNRWKGFETRTPRPSIEQRMFDSDGGAGNAVEAGINKQAADAASKRKFDENGRYIEKAENGLDFMPNFEHINRTVTDGGAVFQGLIAGGLAMLAGKLAGGDKADIGTLFFLAGSNRFGNAMNQSHRYKNIDSLRQMGYTPESIEAYVESGDRSALEKVKLGDWKEYPDGSGDSYRTLPNGDTEFREGTPKWEKYEFLDEDGNTRIGYFNEIKGTVRNQVDKNGNEVLDKKGNPIPVSYIKTPAKATAVGTNVRIARHRTDRSKPDVQVIQKGDNWVYADTFKPADIEGYDILEKETGKGSAAGKDDGQKFDTSSTLGSINRLVTNGAYKVMSNRKGQLYSTQAGRFIGGDAVVGVEAAAQQLGSLGFLNEINRMRGFGSLSNAEGNRLVSAYNGLFTTDKNGKTTMVDGLSEEEQQSYLADLVKATLIADYASTNPPVLDRNGQPTPEWMAQRDAHVRNVYANDYKHWHSELGSDLDETINFRRSVPGTETEVQGSGSKGPKTWGAATTAAPAAAAAANNEPSYLKYLNK